MRIIACFLLLTLATGRVLAQVDPPSPIEAIMKVIKAYAAYESGKTNTEIDIEGSTDWYRRYFITYSPLKVDYDLSPPVVLESTRDAKGVRLSTLMCPNTNFTYDCRLDAAVIRGSASSTQHSSSWNAGFTTKQTWMYGVGFLGTGGKIGPTAQFSFSKTMGSGTVDATTEQATNTGTQQLTVNPSASSCYEVNNYMNKATQKGRSKLMAVYVGWVGFHDGDSTVWKDDNSGSHYYRLRNIWDIVRTAQGAGLPEANGFDTQYIPKINDWAVTYSNEFDFDFFLGSEGRGTIKNYSSSSDNCIKMLPEGWDTWLPPVNPTSGSAAARTGGRRLAGQFNVRLLPETLQPMDEHGGKATLTATTSRLLLADTQPSATSAPQRLKNCPHRVYHHSVHKNVTRWDNPTCQGAGFAAHQARMQQHRKAAAMRGRQCSVAIRNSTGRVISKLPFNSCVVRRTPRAELDARDAARRVAARASPSAGEPGDFFSKLTSLVQAICYYESKTNCDVDSQGTTDWYKQYFSNYQPVTGMVGADDIRMSPTTDFSATSSSWFCAYNPSATFLCQSASADMTSKANTQSTTTSFNFQFKLGFKIKAQASFLGIGPSAEYETENTVDWGYQFTDGTSTTTTDGASTTTTVRIPMTASMNKCAIITIVTRKASAKGATRAWVCAEGWVGTHQDSAKNWPDFDSSGGETHYYRAFTLAYAVNFAQQKNLNAGNAFDWYVDGQGRACLYNAVDMRFDQGVMSYVRPQLFDKDAPECRPGNLGLGQHPLAPRTGASDEILPAVPIPGCQNVPYDEATGKGCDKL